ncbi:hypothetical protein [Fodinibius sp.]|uniref:hypothetical protein n=1 Tax=Fodinibius sp. TaxID=1872440 RepID=UPI002ACEB976|nr:hypothetical protein [Fodinibius sp.]MDZ7657973.1 hypothetical protein [Fodinibius sp.]
MNKLKILLTILVVLLLGLGWYLLSEKPAQDSPQSEPVYSDSVPEAERPVFTAQEDTIEEDTAEEEATPPPAGEDLAPGTALVKAVVISDDFDSKGNMKLTVKAEEILGYGSATSPIGAQQELTISVGRYLKNNPEDKALMQKGKTIRMVISSEEGMSLGESQDSKRWSLVEVKSQ